MTDIHLAAIVLAGGRSKRFGSDKLETVVHGTPLVRHSVDAAVAVGASVVVVGPTHDGLPAGVVTVREDPPLSTSTPRSCSCSPGTSSIPDRCCPSCSRR